jgi:tRNA(Ile2) C34 agmatinyltransferase TiaS
MIVSILTAITFFGIVAIILMQLPASIEKDKLVKAIKEELQKDIEETLPFCPECKSRVKPEWKCCPNCSAKFTD